MIILAAAIIISLNNAGIINKANQAVKETDLAQVQHLATLKWSEAYLDSKRTQAELDTYVRTELGKEIGDLSKYEITVTEKGVDVTLKDGSTDKKDWSENVAAIVDGVPIPKGFVASPYNGERTKDGGLVIYELASNETAIPETETQHTSLTTRNQYVWVPVDNFSKFVRGSYNNWAFSNVLGSAVWEVALNTTTNMPLAQQDMNFMTSNTLTEVQAMYESVKEYGGFYIARYEAGIDSQRTEQGTAENLPRGTNVYSRMNKIPYTYIPWTWEDVIDEDTNGAVEVARSIYPDTSANKTGVISTLTYSVQWDATLYWWSNISVKDINGNEMDLDLELDKHQADVNKVTAYGNYVEHEIASAEALNDGAQIAVFYNGDVNSYTGRDSATVIYPKAGAAWALSTGALKAGKVNNIYDMAGNMCEWTMGGLESTLREVRGGWLSHYEMAGNGPVGYLGTSSPNTANNYFGFRPSLYIKK